MGTRHGLRNTAAVGAVLLACAAVLSACTDGSASGDTTGPAPGDDGTSTVQPPGAAADDRAWPGASWETATPQQAGLDPEVLDAVAAEARATGSNCLLVTRDGRLVAEWYWQGTGPDTAQEVYSASKSFTSVLVGMAVDDGALTVADRASEWIPQWRGTDSEEVTVEHLLNNTSGRYHDFRTDYVEMAALAEDKTAYAVGLGQQHPPGERWVYNNSAIQALEAVFAGATGTDLADVAEDRLFGPLGMADTDLGRDDSGNPLAFMGISSTCRDMARFGLMALRDGEWDGEQVVSRDWMQRSTGAPSQEHNASYGWLWWLNVRGPSVDPSADPDAVGVPEEGQVVPGAPEDMFFASGLGGQMIVVDPTTGTVVVRLGPATYPEGTERFERAQAARVATEAVTGPGDRPAS